jgi:hypothetical protein
VGFWSNSIARRRRGITSLVLLAGLLANVSVAQAASASSGAASGPQANNEQSYYEHAHPYIDEPVAELVKRVPQLKELHPSGSQQELPVILLKTGNRVDDFFRHVTDLTAREEISLTRLRQEKPYSRPELSGERVRDSYLILRHSNTGQAEIIEYRTDPNGGNFDPLVTKKGFLVTSGFALTCNYFSNGFQPESTFLYLGDQKIGSRDTYVVGFAQQAAKATLTVRVKAPNGTTAHLLVQGIAWIDKSDFQIVRMRTDLLAPRRDVGLNQQTTEVTLGKVQLVDVATPLWLPSSVRVYVEFTTHNGDVDEFFELSYRNEHRYTDYQRYRVSAKVVP